MITHGEINGHRALYLENERLRVTVLPEKGADIYEFIHKPSGVDFLMKTPSGLQPPGDRPPADFLENYEGAWQELFPNTNEACVYRGVTQPFHGEVALLPWDHTLEQDDEAGVAVRFSVHCRRSPFHLERRMRLRRGESALTIEGTVTNEGDEPTDFVWGQHLVLGGDFLEEGCLLDVPGGGTIVTPDKPYEPARARLAPGQREAWPMACGRQPGETVDLRAIPGPKIRSHDDAFLIGFDRGEASVTNPRLGLRFTFTWDASLFRALVLWQPYGGPERPPLTGTYGLGMEPWVAMGNLAQSIERGEAVRLGPGQQLATALRAAVTDLH